MLMSLIKTATIETIGSIIDEICELTEELGC